MQVALRQGLRGDAKTKWYLQLSSENRKWDAVRPLFTKRFKICDADMGRGVLAKVFYLRRRPAETIRDFVSRATELSYQCTEERMKELRYCLHAYIMVPENHPDFAAPAVDDAEKGILELLPDLEKGKRVPGMTAGMTTVDDVLPYALAGLERI